MSGLSMSCYCSWRSHYFFYNAITFIFIIYNVQISTTHWSNRDPCSHDNTASIKADVIASWLEAKECRLQHKPYIGTSSITFLCCFSRLPSFLITFFGRTTSTSEEISSTARLMSTMLALCRRMPLLSFSTPLMSSRTKNHRTTLWSRRETFRSKHQWLQAASRKGKRTQKTSVTNPLSSLITTLAFTWIVASSSFILLMAP